jgi:hypothetical protein
MLRLYIVQPSFWWLFWRETQVCVSTTFNHRSTIVLAGDASMRLYIGLAVQQLQ